jgi:hypothetical protein
MWIYTFFPNVAADSWFFLVLPSVVEPMFWHKKETECFIKMLPNVERAHYLVHLFTSPRADSVASMMSLAGVFSEVLLPADESITCSNQIKLCRLLTACWQFGYTGGCYYFFFVSINSELEMWNVMVGMVFHQQSCRT